MIALIVALLSLVLPLIHLALIKGARTRGRVVHVLLLYALVLDVGVIGLPLGFIPHVFFPNQAAELIGWPPGSPFQLEVGFHDGAWGLLGFLSIWIEGSFWFATGLGWSFFMLGATYGHVYQTLHTGKLCSLQFPDDLLGRFHSGLAVSAAVSLLALGWFQQQDQISGQQWLSSARGADSRLRAPTLL